MTRRVSVLFLALVAAVSLCANGFAASTPEIDAAIKVVDLADLLTDSEERKLSDYFAGISEQIDMDIVFLSVWEESISDMRQYAEDFYEFNGYGFNQEYDGYMLYINMATRDVNTLTSGRANAVMDTRSQDMLLDEILPYLSDGDYLQAGIIFADELYSQTSYMSEMEIDEGYAEIAQKLDSQEGLTVAGAAGIATAVSAGVILILYLIHGQSLPKKPGLQAYFDEKGMRMTRSEDIFLRTNTVRTEIPKNTGGGSGGSGGVHRSSGGRTFGGGSGRKF